MFASSSCLYQSVPCFVIFRRPFVCRCFIRCLPFLVCVIPMTLLCFALASCEGPRPASLTIGHCRGSCRLPSGVVMLYLYYTAGAYVLQWESAGKRKYFYALAYSTETGYAYASRR